MAKGEGRRWEVPKKAPNNGNLIMQHILGHPEHPPLAQGGSQQNSAGLCQLQERSTGLPVNYVKGGLG